MARATLCRELSSFALRVHVMCSYPVPRRSSCSFPQLRDDASAVRRPAIIAVSHLCCLPQARHAVSKLEGIAPLISAAQDPDVKTPLPARLFLPARTRSLSRPRLPSPSPLQQNANTYACSPPAADGRAHPQGGSCRDRPLGTAAARRGGGLARRGRGADRELAAGLRRSATDAGSLSTKRSA